jgi:excisionase family DNA binding protein
MEQTHFSLDLSGLKPLFQDWVKEVITENSLQNTTSAPEQPDADKLLTVEEAAEFLLLSKYTLYSKVSRKELPASKAGKRLYFSRSDLNNYLRANRRYSLSEIKSRAEDHLKIISPNPINP